MNGTPAGGNVKPCVLWQAMHCDRRMSPRPSFVLYPNRPLKLYTGLALLREHVQVCKSTETLCCYVRFDQPYSHAALLFVRPLMGVAEYIDPRGGDEADFKDKPSGNGPHQHFEAMLRTTCQSMGLVFYGSLSIFGALRPYTVSGDQDGAPKRVLWDRIFATPHRVSRAFLEALRVSQKTNEHRELFPQLQQLVHEFDEEGFSATACSFWALHLARAAFAADCLVRDWLRSREWYFGEADYMTIGAWVTKYFIGAMAEELYACRRWRDTRAEP